MIVFFSQQLAFKHVSSAAHTAKMVTKVADAEIENTEDPKFKADLVAAKDRVSQCTNEPQYTHVLFYNPPIFSLCLYVL